MLGVTQLKVFTLTLTLSLKGEGMIEPRKSYHVSSRPFNPIAARPFGDIIA